MICLHRLRGTPFHLNIDRIETVEATPDTVVTLTDGKRLLVTETPAQVAAAVTRYRTQLTAAAAAGQQEPTSPHAPDPRQLTIAGVDRKV